MKPDMTPEELLTEALKVIDEQDIGAGIRLLDSHTSPLAAKIYPKVQLEQYWKRKNVPAMVAVSQAGIRYCLASASQSADVETAYALQSAAKALAYNLASFTWPGWDEKGITLTPADVLVGLEAARLN